MISFLKAMFRFSRTLNNCKVPQIRYATPDRLLQRLTDLRFLSIDFLNTFLLTYRVFADGVQVRRQMTRSLSNIQSVSRESNDRTLFPGSRGSEESIF